MPDGGQRCTEDTLRDLAEIAAVPGESLAARLSELISAFVPHEALIILASDASGGRRRGSGDPGFVRGVSFLDLDELRRSLVPGPARIGSLEVGGVRVPTLSVLSRNGALLVIARPRPTGHEGIQVEGTPAESTPAESTQVESVVQIWNIVALRVQELADAAAPGYLQLARASSGERMEALTELADEYSTTLESVLAALRSASLGDAAARQAATALAAEGLVHLRTASDRVRTVTEEPVTTAFQRLRDDLRPLVRYRDIDMQFVEPPLDGRPLPSEVAHGARAVVRGAILALIESAKVRRVRVQWDCDGENLLVDLRDDGDGELSEHSVQFQLVRQRIHALDGRLTLSATRGWGTELSVVIPLDPPRSAATATPTEWSLRRREAEVLEHLVEGRRNREIAAELGISENTVKFHVAALYRKLGVGTRAEATSLYLSTVAASGIASRHRGV